MDGLQGNGISTFGGNPVATAAANATLDYVLSHDLQSRAATLGRLITGGLREAAAPLPAAGEVGGRASCSRWTWWTRARGSPARRWPPGCSRKTRERGLLIGKGGLYGHTLRMAPPLTLTDAEAREGLAILTDALRAVSAEATDSRSAEAAAAAQEASR